MNKLILLAATLLAAQISFGQCAYEFNEKDMITGEPSFKTKKFKLSKKIKKKKTFSCAGVDGQFEKTGDGEFLIISFKITESYGKGVVFLQGQDNLILKFTDGETKSLGVGRMINVVSNAFGLFYDITYKINEDVKTSFKEKSVSSFRISGMTFDIDVEIPEADLSAKFKDCWVN